MKIETKPAVFQPVVITLETQEEVDQLYAVVNFVPIFESLGDSSVVQELQSKLDPFAGNHHPLHDKVEKALNTWARKV